MIRVITGSSFAEMIRYGLTNLENNCSDLNDLNVFPVPDGDTGTNMVVTIKNGFSAIKPEMESLSDVSAAFSNATVFGARGNSGVIVSQFLKGVAVGFEGLNEADCKAFSKALDSGCKRAYSAVAKPVEGTMLTVIREASEAVRSVINEIHTVGDLVSCFLARARISLENTPELLPVLAKAGVVDSGGAGIVCFFEGIESYLNGEPIEKKNPDNEHKADVIADFSAFNKDTVFEYGYCTEFLLQLTVDEECFDLEEFKKTLGEQGDSLVASLENDKLKVHIHSHHPENILAICHAYGEFLTMKIENMSVQHQQTHQKFYCSKNGGDSDIAVVAVAPNTLLQTMLGDMGADVAILSKEVPSSQDFIDAFELVTAENILVFPNCANSILSAQQAAELFGKSNIKIINCRSIAECYSALAIIDFDTDDLEGMIKEIEATIDNVYQISVIRAVKDTCYGGKDIIKGHYFALSGEDLLGTSESITEIADKVIKDVLCDDEKSVVNLFCGKNVTEEQIDSFVESVEMSETDAEVFTIMTDDTVYDLIVSFE